MRNNHLTLRTLRLSYSPMAQSELTTSNPLVGQSSPRHYAKAKPLSQKLMQRARKFPRRSLLGLRPLRAVTPPSAPFVLTYASAPSVCM